MKTRRWAVLISVLIAAFALVSPAGATKEQDIGPAGVGGSTGFMEVRTDGGLWYYAWDGFKYVAYPTDSTGWGQTKLIATVSSDRFVELKGDLLRTWRLFWNGSAYRVQLLEESCCGWATMRSITGVGNVRGDGGNEIIGVTANGDLMLYLSRGNGYVWEERLDNGYERVPLIAGLGGFGRDAIGHFVGVNNHGDLYEFHMGPPGTKPVPTRRMSGWENVRLLGPGGTVPGTANHDSFTSIRHNGQLVQWYWLGANYATGYTDTNWFNARLIG